jgi:hypothetical protein
VNIILNDLVDALGQTLTCYILGIDSTTTLAVLLQVDSGLRNVNYGGARYAWFAIQYFKALGVPASEIQSAMVSKNDFLDDKSPAVLFSSRAKTDWEHALSGCIHRAAE